MGYIPTGNELIDPFKLLEQVNIRAGMKVVELGCGTLGHYVFPAAQLVGSHGKVYAVDILKSVLSGIESRMKMEGTTNVVSMWGDIERERGVNLGDGEMDLALLINNIFMSKERDGLLREASRLVRRGGWLLIVEWKPTGSALGPEPSQRVSAEEAKRLAAAQGLVLEKEIEPGDHHYGLLFHKPLNTAG